MSKGVWLDAELHKPPRKECYGEFWASEPVLIVVNGKEVKLGYYQSWDEEPQWNCWKLVGRDHYTIDGVTHFRTLPPLPPLDLNEQEKCEWTKDCTGMFVSTSCGDELCLASSRDDISHCPFCGKEFEFKESEGQK